MSVSSLSHSLPLSMFKERRVKRRGEKLQKFTVELLLHCQPFVQFQWGPVAWKKGRLIDQLLLFPSNEPLVGEKENENERNRERGG